MAAIITYMISVEAQPAPLRLSMTACTSHGAADGTATAHPSDFLQTPLTYLWSNNETTAEITDLVAGIYTCTMTTYDDIVIEESIVVTQPGA